MQVMAHQLADYLANGDHDPAQQHQALAQLEAAQAGPAGAEHRRAAGPPGPPWSHPGSGPPRTGHRGCNPAARTAGADPQLDQVGVFVPALDDRTDTETVV